LRPDLRTRQVSRGSDFLAQGAITLVVAVRACLALDDIATDSSAGSCPKYLLLAAAGAGSLRLASPAAAGQRVVAAASIVAVLAAAAVASDGLSHARDGGWATFWLECSVKLAASLWFVALSGILLALGRRQVRPGA
jgi:hypothetical protein